MTPLSIVAAQTLAGILTNNNTLQQQVASISAQAGIVVPTITPTQVILSSAAAELGDKNIQLSYPRVCIYSNNVKNTQTEKFRSFSGQVTVVAEIWASGDLITDVDSWIHFYVEGVAEILQANRGDWGNGMFYSGAYEVQFLPPKAGGLGFVEAAKVTFSLNVSIG